MTNKPSIGSLLANKRWANPEADRDQPRRAGAMGGRPVTCTCALCPKCRRRQRRNGGLLISAFGLKVNSSEVKLTKAEQRRLDRMHERFW